MVKKEKKKKKIPKSFTVFPDMKEGQRQRTTSHSQNNREACVATPLGKLQSRRGASGSLAQARSAPGGEITEAGSFLLDWGIPRRASAASEPVQAWPHGWEWGRGDCLSRPWLGILDSAETCLAPNRRFWDGMEGGGWDGGAQGRREGNRPDKPLGSLPSVLHCPALESSRSRFLS